MIKKHGTSRKVCEQNYVNICSNEHYEQMNNLNIWYDWTFIAKKQWYRD